MSKSSNTKKRAAERGVEGRRKTLIIELVGVGILAVLTVGILILLSSQPKATDIESNYAGLTQETVQIGQAEAFALGDPNAPVTLTEYADFSCPHCRDLAPELHKLIESHVRTGKVRLVYVPVSFVAPEYSVPAAKAAICAEQQGKFWQMHDEIWNLNNSSGPPAFTETLLTARARKLGLDIDQFSTCFNSQDTDATVQAIVTEAGVRGVTGTPTLFLNDQRFDYRGPETAYDDLTKAIDAIDSGS